MRVVTKISEPTIAAMKHVSPVICGLAFIFVTSLFISVSVQAQQPDAEHQSHHPDGQPLPENQIAETTGIISSSQSPSGMGGQKGAGKGNGMSKMMDGMMEKMGAPKPKDLYPSLMRLPELPPEQRDKVAGDAQRRMEKGTGTMLRGFTALSQANARRDFELMQVAVNEIEQGLAQYDSGLAAKRALVEGQAPSNVALQWFKREMNLLPTLESERSYFFLGMSPLHTGIMSILLVFAAVMIWMYLFKMRRAAALLVELREQPDAVKKREHVEPTPSTDPVIHKQRSPVATTSVVPPSDKSGRYNGPLKVIGIFTETHDVKTFRLAVPDGQPLPFTYEPGQFATLTLTIPAQSKPVKRSYTIASSPTQRDYLELTIKRESHGLVSQFMHDAVVLNSLLEVKVPNGRFYFNGRDTNSVVLISGGVGITPMMSAARYLTDQCWPGEIYFLFCTRTSNDFIFQQELMYMQARHKNLHVLVSMTQAEGTSWMGPQGRFTPQLINDFVPDIVSKEIHICGPQPMMDGVTLMLTELGVPDTLIQTEAFGAAPKAKKPPPLLDTAPPLQASTPTSVTTPPSHTALNVQFLSSKKTAPIAADETVLEAAEAVDVEIDNSCRAGSCGSCVVKLVSGTVTMDVDDGLESEQKANGYILACQAIASTDIEVEA